MRATIRLIPAFLALGISSAASAETVSYTGMSSYYTNLSFKYGSSTLNTSAGLMKIKIDGVSTDAYCVDLDHGISSGYSGSASLVSMPAETPWCEINYMLQNYSATSGATGATIQGALWESVSGADLTFWNLYTTTVSTVDPLVNALVDEAEGKCPLFCSDEVSWDIDLVENNDGTLSVSAALTRKGGEAVVGQTLDSWTDAGTWTVDGDGVTDASGAISGTIDLSGGETSVTFYVEGAGLDLIRVEWADTSKQKLLAWDDCLFEDPVTWTAGGLGDPRTIGFWKHQLATATGASKGKGHVSASQLGAMLPIDVFGTEIDSLSAAYDALWVGSTEMEDRAIQQCLATSLNVAWGQASWFSGVDLDRDGADDGLLWELWQDAEAAYATGDFETAKTICDTFNNL